MASHRIASNSNPLSAFQRRSRLRWRRCAGPCMIFLAAAVATTPQIFRGNSCGHDFDFHLVSWFDCLANWKHGIVYPHWSPSSNYGAGEPRFIFYPPLTWMLGAALAVILPWPIVPIALTFLLLAGTGLATRAFARQMLPDAPATLAGCAALFSGYALFTAYERTAFGELAGGFWIPLLLLLIFRWRIPLESTLREALNGSAALLALVVAGAWLSNAPLGVMASYLLAAIAFTLSILYRSCAPILRAAMAAILSLGLSAFYLVPAAYEQHWVDIRQVTEDPGERIENSFLFGHHDEPQLHVHNVELHRVSVLALTMIGIALLGLFVAWHRKTLPADHRRWLPLGLIPVAVLVLLLPVSLPVWTLLPKLRFLQFPWRWMVVVEAPMAILFASAVWPRISASRWLRVAVPSLCAATFLGATSIAAIAFFQPCDNEDAVAPMLLADQNGNGFQGTDEYAPPDADNSLVATGLPDACLVTDPDTALGTVAFAGANPDWSAEQHSCDQTAAADAMTSRSQKEHVHLHAVLTHSGYLILRLRSYPAWRIVLNNQPPGPLARRDDGLIELPVSQGPIDLTVDWTTTPDVLIGCWISALTLLFVFALGIVERRSKRTSRRHLS